MNLIENILNTETWKIAHVEVNRSFISAPHQNIDGSISDTWVIGPMSKISAEWLFDAIKIKQELIKRRGLNEKD